LWQVRFLSVQCNFHLVVFGMVNIKLRSLCMVEKYRLRPCFIDGYKKISYNGQHDIFWISFCSAGNKSHPVSSSRAPLSSLLFICFRYIFRHLRRINNPIFLLTFMERLQELNILNYVNLDLELH
jgi:hypothetical protein